MSDGYRDAQKLVYKVGYADYGIRLTGLVLLPHEEAVGSIYRGLYYDNSGYDAFRSRYVVISAETLKKDWVLDE